LSASEIQAIYTRAPLGRSSVKAPSSLAEAKERPAMRTRSTELKTIDRRLSPDEQHRLRKE
ncbi:MAG: hypothetical protein NT154_15860, partial [Verrucomicrobia bacterium]|nr:hypothetical protein [Verrucomicrobiota bacterium]